MAEIAWTRESEWWLAEIYGHIAEDNPVAALETVEGIYEQAQILADLPECGSRYWASKRHVRILLYGHFRIAYLVKDDRNVDILGVFHGSLDISKYPL
jgi:toxin ParE1/3/4